MTPPLWQKVKRNTKAFRILLTWPPFRIVPNTAAAKILPNLVAPNRWGNSGNSGWLYFGGAPKSLQMVTAAMKLKDAYSLEGK